MFRRKTIFIKSPLTPEQKESFGLALSLFILEGDMKKESRNSLRSQYGRLMVFVKHITEKFDINFNNEFNNFTEELDKQVLCLKEFAEKL